MTSPRPTGSDRSAIAGGVPNSPAQTSDGSGSAPGRICLVGEHCDWAGGQALTVPMDRAVTVEWSKSAVHLARSSDGPVRVTSWFEGREQRWNGQGDPGLFRLVPAVFTAVGEPLVGHIAIGGDLPAGRGFSSSAAVCVALVRALRPYWGPDEIAEIAYRAERATGSACGRMDPLACAWAVPLSMRFHGESVLVEPISGRCALAVGVFPTPRDTVGILRTLNQHHAGEVALRDWAAVGRVGAVRGAIEGFAAQAGPAAAALRDHDLRALGGAMDACQEIYEEELVPAFPELRAPGLVRAVRALRAGGALGAKFTGAGGDGSVIGLYPPGGAAEGVRALDALGLSAFCVEVFAPA